MDVNDDDDKFQKDVLFS